MTIVLELSESHFIDLFRDYGRSENFSYEALQALYEYYDSLSDETGEPFKMDVIGICCDWTEASAAEVVAEYDTGIDISDDSAAMHDAALEYLEGETTVIDLGETLLYVAF